MDAQTKKLLVEFEKQYTGDVRDNMNIYVRIAEKFDMDLDVVIDTILINRYADEDDFSLDREDGEW